MESMQNFRPYMLLFLTVIVTGCSGVRVSQDYPANTDYAALKTYAWQSEEQEKTGDLRLDNPLRDKRIRQAIDTFLTEKGYWRVTGIQPDFLIAYHQKIYSRIDADNSGSGFVFGMGSFGRQGGIGMSVGNRTTEYDESMMVITIIDSSSNDVIWRGTGTRRFAQHAEPEKITKQINENVTKILMQFPPQEKPLD